MSNESKSKTKVSSVSFIFVSQRRGQITVVVNSNLLCRGTACKVEISLIMEKSADGVHRYVRMK